MAAITNAAHTNQFLFTNEVNTFKIKTVVEKNMIESIIVIPQSLPPRLDVSKLFTIVEHKVISKTYNNTCIKLVPSPFMISRLTILVVPKH